MRGTRIILIGGPSHVGKSTLAHAMAAQLRWKCISTDSLARHPGRPWKTEARDVPQHVADHYLTLSIDELITDVLRHYERMWPATEALIRTHASDLSADRLIIEGSAIWPERVAVMDFDNVAAFWLTANSQFLEARIHAASRFDQATSREKALIEKFLDRTHRYNDLMMNAVNKLHLDSIDVSAAPPSDRLIEQALRLIDE